MSTGRRLYLYLAVLFITLAMIILLIYKPVIIYAQTQPTKAHVDILLGQAYEKFHIPNQGIIHIGARYAEELKIYKKYNVYDILWIEADPTAKSRLTSKISKDPGSRVAFFAATDTNGTIDLHHTSNNGHSSSIYNLKNHLIMAPNVVEDQIINVKQQRLDSYLDGNTDLVDINYNIIVIDVQGAELLALKGAVNTLRNIDAIIAEVNYDDLYDGAVKVDELDAFLVKHNFIRVDAISVNQSYGDALYVKEKCCKLGV